MCLTGVCGFRVVSTELGEYLNMVQGLESGGACAKAWLFEFLTCASIPREGEAGVGCSVQ